MNPAEILPHLERWRHEMEHADKVCETYLEPLKLAPESPVYSVIWTLQDAMTDAVSRLVGDRDAWLSWYRYDTAMGAKAMEAQISGKTYKVRTLKQLARVIVESNK